MLLPFQETSRHIHRNNVPGNDTSCEGDKADVSQEVPPDGKLLPEKDSEMTFELNLSDEGAVCGKPKEKMTPAETAHCKGALREEEPPCV